MDDLERIETLRDAFGHAAGAARLLLLLSPT